MKVKKELAKHVSNAMHCRIAELSALISMCGSVLIDDNSRKGKGIVVEDISF